MTETTNQLRCALCPYTTALWVGGKEAGYAVMAAHVADEHEEEHRLMRAGLAELDEDIRRDEEEAEGVY